MPANIQPPHRRTADHGKKAKINGARDGKATPQQPVALPPGPPQPPTLYMASQVIDPRLRLGALPTPRLVAHVFSIGGGPRYEGTITSYALQEMYSHLQTLSTQGLDGPTAHTVGTLLTQVHQCAVWARTLENKRSHAVAPMTREITHAIRTQPRVLIPCLLVSVKSGHATLLETRRQTNGCYTLRLFNTARPTDDPHHVIADGTKRQAYFEVRDVSAQVMHDRKSIEWLLRLGHGSTVPAANLGIPMKKLYAWLNKVGEKTPPAADYHASQTVGNCAWKCITSWVKSHLTQTVYLSLKRNYQANILGTFTRHLPMMPAMLAILRPVYGAYVSLSTGASVWLPAGVAALPVGHGMMPDPAAVSLQAFASLKLAKTNQRLQDARARLAPPQPKR